MDFRDFFKFAPKGREFKKLEKLYELSEGSRMLESDITELTEYLEDECGFEDFGLIYEDGEPILQIFCEYLDSDDLEEVLYIVEDYDLDFEIVANNNNLCINVFEVDLDLDIEV